MRYLIFFAAVFSVSPALAVGPNWDLSQNLATILASEEPCGLSYDQQAIEKFISSKVSPDDMEFPSELTGNIGVQQFVVSKLSKSALTAHCTQIRRIAKKYGFVN